MVHEKFTVTVWEYSVLAVQLFILPLATYLLWQLWTVTEGISQEKERLGNPSVVRSRSGSRSRSTVSARMKKLRVKKGSFKYLLFLEPMELVFGTGVTIYARLLSDTLSWIYTCATGVWDWFVVITDGISVALGTLSAVLLVFVCIQRCYMTFETTPIQHSQLRYATICSLAMLTASAGIFMASMSIGLQWWYFGFGAIGFVVLLFSSSSLTTWSLMQPLLAMAGSNQKSGGKMLHLSARITLVSSMALFSTLGCYLLAAIGYATCEECLLIYIYYGLVALDTLINLQCLMWSLKTGQASYFKWCRVPHRAFVNWIDTRQPQFRTPMPWEIEKSVLSATGMGSQSHSAASVPKPSTLEQGDIKKPGLETTATGMESRSGGISPQPCIPGTKKVTFALDTK